MRRAGVNVAGVRYDRGVPALVALLTLALPRAAAAQETVCIGVDDFNAMGEEVTSGDLTMRFIAHGGGFDGSGVITLVDLLDDRGGATCRGLWLRSFTGEPCTASSQLCDCRAGPGCAGRVLLDAWDACSGGGFTLFPVDRGGDPVLRFEGEMCELRLSFLLPGEQSFEIECPEGRAVGVGSLPFGDMAISRIVPFVGTELPGTSDFMLESSEICFAREGCVDCECAPAEEMSCTAPAEGACAFGLQRCMPEGRYGPCEPRDPAPETCGDGRDDDCDGSVDEGCPACDPSVDPGCELPADAGAAGGTDAGPRAGPSPVDPDARAIGGGLSCGVTGGPGATLAWAALALLVVRRVGVRGA